MNKLLATLVASLFAAGAMAQATAPAAPATGNKAGSQNAMKEGKPGAGPKSAAMMTEKDKPGPGPKKSGTMMSDKDKPLPPKKMESAK